MKIKVISLNIWEGILLDQAVSFLKQEDADLLLLQEVYGHNDPLDADQFRTLEIVKDSLGLPYDNYVPGLRHRREEGRFLQGNTVLSKFPILSASANFFNDPYNDDYVAGAESNPIFPHSLQRVVLDTPAGETNVFNLHGTWDLDGNNYSEKRRQMSDAIIEAARDKVRVILAGDTNAKPTNPAMHRVEEYLVSVFGNELKSTFNMKHKDNPGYATAAVDMMFVSHDIKVIDKLCPQVDVSDHLPLVVSLEI